MFLSFQTLQCRGSAKHTRHLSSDFGDWNPFGDDNFSGENDDMLFGEEFDKIRRGSNTSEGFSNTVSAKVFHLKRNYYTRLVIFHFSFLKVLIY